MGRPSELTREMLEDYGITLITKDGRVFCGDYEKYPYVITKSTRYSSKQYRVIQLYDTSVYKARKAAGKPGGGIKMVVLSRAIWAWYHKACPADMDVDHINNDSLDDRLSNYQLLTRQENLAKRKGHRNQYECSLVY